MRFRNDIERINRERETLVCDITKPTPSKKVVARTTANRRFVCPDYFWSFRAIYETELIPGLYNLDVSGCMNTAMRKFSGSAAPR